MCVITQLECELWGESPARQHSLGGRGEGEHAALSAIEMQCKMVSVFCVEWRVKYSVCSAKCLVCNIL